MRYGSTDIRVIQDAQARPDYPAVVRQLQSLPGVLAAVVAWENEELDDWESELVEQGPAGNPIEAAKARLLAW